MYKFYINGQKIVAEVPTSVSDTIDWLTAEFRFSDDWNGLDKWAHFKFGTTTYDINLEEDKITADMHLNLGAGLWKVYLHGNAYDGDDVVQRAVTDSCMIRVKQADTLSGQPLPTVPPSATEQILAKVSNASNKADAAALSASSAQASATSAQTSASQAAASASGKYTKPSTGIPKTDLASAVQTSLGKADSALQEHQSLSAYRTASEQDEIDNGIAEDINELADTVGIIDESKYEKPSDGIPSTDMTEAVQTSLGKADTALQEHQSLSAYRTSAEQDLLDADKVSDIKINGTSIVDDGVGNIPMASYAEYGVIKGDGTGAYGININSQGIPYINEASSANIDARSSSRRPIIPSNLDYAVKSAMCDGRGASWSESEQKACRKRIGRDSYEFIETIELTEDVASIVRNSTPDGRAYNFRKVMFRIALKSGATMRYLIPYFNNVTSAVHCSYVSGVANGVRYSTLLCDVTDGILMSMVNIQTYPTSQAGFSARVMSSMAMIDTINLIQLLDTTTGLIESGTKIEIYAIWA